MKQYKRFDKKLYEENDQKAKKAGIKFWKSQGYNIEENKDKYGPDLIAEKNGKKHYVEVEIKYNWKEEKFQYDDLQIPERKSKFAKLDLKTYFMVFNSLLNRAFICSTKNLLESPVQNVANKYMYKENFFKIPIKKLKLVSM